MLFNEFNNYRRLLMNDFKKMLLLLKSKCKKYGIKYNVRKLSAREIREMQESIPDRQKKLLDSCEYNVTDDIKGAMNIRKKVRSEEKGNIKVAQKT